MDQLPLAAKCFTLDADLGVSLHSSAYALDASFGWVVPMSSGAASNSGLGWSVTGQVGLSIFGADSLTLAATAGNVIGAQGFAGSAGYVMSFAD